jgi:LysM repeat protein
MQPWKRALIFLLINIVISASTTLAVLFVWDLTHPEYASVSNAAKNLGSTPPSTAAVAENPNKKAATATLVMDEYVVREGDTLGEIADKYKVSIDTLLKVNGLKDANSISVGMAIYVPLTPQVFPTDTPVVTRTPIGATPTLAPGAQPPGVVINSVIGAGDITSERVFITRTGSGPLIMNGWKLVDADGNNFVFPDLVLFEGGAVNIWTTSGTSTVVDLYWGLSNAVWSSGEKVTLLNEQGKVAATYTIP